MTSTADPEGDTRKRKHVDPGSHISQTAGFDPSTVQWTNENGICCSPREKQCEAFSILVNALMVLGMTSIIGVGPGGAGKSIVIALYVLWWVIVRKTSVFLILPYEIVWRVVNIVRQNIHGHANIHGPANVQFHVITEIKHVQKVFERLLCETDGSVVHVFIISISIVSAIEDTNNEVRGFVMMMLTAINFGLFLCDECQRLFNTNVFFRRLQEFLYNLTKGQSVVKIGISMEPLRDADPVHGVPMKSFFANPTDNVFNCLRSGIVSLFPGRPPTTHKGLLVNVATVNPKSLFPQGRNPRKTPMQYVTQHGVYHNGTQTEDDGSAGNTKDTLVIESNPKFAFMVKFFSEAFIRSRGSALFLCQAVAAAKHLHGLIAQRGLDLLAGMMPDGRRVYFCLFTGDECIIIGTGGVTSTMTTDQMKRFFSEEANPSDQIIIIATVELTEMGAFDLLPVDYILFMGFRFRIPAQSLARTTRTEDSLNKPPPVICLETSVDTGKPVEFPMPSLWNTAFEARNSVSIGALPPPVLHAPINMDNLCGDLVGYVLGESANVPDGVCEFKLSCADYGLSQHADADGV